MTDAGFVEIVKRLLAQNTRKGAREVVASIGGDYRELSERLAERMTFDRTNDQNALLWKWNAEVAKHQGETKEDVHRESKLSIGCPILFRDNEEFAAFYRRVLAPQDRAERLKAMDFIDVSSVMTTKQMSEFMDEFEKKWRLRGVPLTIPEAA